MRKIAMPIFFSQIDVIENDFENWSAASNLTASTQFT